MAGEKFRFLLRMPIELRERLLEASRESDRSLNAEIVDRLERSCRPSLADRAAAALRIIPVLEGEGFMKGRLRLTLAEPQLGCEPCL